MVVNLPIKLRLVGIGARMYDAALKNVEKYDKKVNEDLLKAILKTYRLVLSKKDAKHVACGQESELATVKKNFIVKKLGFTDSDKADKAIAEVCAEMKSDKFKSRATFYYLLTKKLNKVDIFV